MSYAKLDLDGRVAVVIGPDDRARGEVMVKDLGGKTQRSIPREQVAAAIAGVVGPPA